MKKKKCPKCGYDSKRDADYCGLCYEPFNKKPAQAVSAPQLPPPSAPPRPLPPLLKAVFLLLGLAAVAALFPALPAVRQEYAARAAGAHRFKDKTDAADHLLAVLAGEKEKLLAEVAAGAEPEGFGLDGKYTARLVKLEEDYAAGINALGLPCPTCVDAEKDKAYLEWTSEHQRRENEAAAYFSGRYQQYIQKALGGK